MHVCKTVILLNFCSLKNTFLNIEIQVICCFQTPWKESDMQLFMRLEGCLYRKYWHYKIFCVNGKYGIQV